MRTRDSFRVWSLGEPDAPEAELVQRFFDGIEKYTPDLVSWNGSGFDLPVLHYRALRHGIVAPRYWERATTTRHSASTTISAATTARHLDLMDVLSSYQARARVSLQGAAVLLGLPGKLGMSGEQGLGRVPGTGRSTRSATTARPTSLNTYLIFLRFELMRGRLLPEEYRAEVARVRDTLAQQAKPHFQEFLAAWQEPHC